MLILEIYFDDRKLMEAAGYYEAYKICDSLLEFGKPTLVIDKNSKMEFTITELRNILENTMEMLKNLKKIKSIPRNWLSR